MGQPFVAVTGDDRANLLAAMYARQLGARTTIAGVSRGEFAPLADAGTSPVKDGGEGATDAAASDAGTGTVASVVSFSYRDDPSRLFGPAFGAPVQAAYAKASTAVLS